MTDVTQRTATATAAEARFDALVAGERRRLLRMAAVLVGDGSALDLARETLLRALVSLRRDP